MNRINRMTALCADGMRTLQQSWAALHSVHSVNSVKKTQFWQIVVQMILGLFVAGIVLNTPAAEEYTFGMLPSDVVVAGKYAYTPVTWRIEKNWTENAYLSVFDLTSGKLANKVSLSGHPRSLVRCGKFLVCSTGAELVVFTIAKPGTPEVTSRVTVHKHPLHAVSRIRAIDDLIFCAVGRSGLIVYRLDQKGTLTQVASHRGEDWGTVVAVAVDAERIAVADTLGLVLLTWKRNGNAIELKPEGRIILPHTSKAVAIEEDIAVIGGSMFELQVVNIRNPAKPVLAGTYRRLTNYYGVSFFDVILKDGLAHIPLGEYAYIIVDVSTPESPTLAMEFKALRRKSGWTRYAMNRYYQGIFVDADARRAYLASERNLEVVDISDIKRPKSLMWITP